MNESNDQGQRGSPPRGFPNWQDLYANEPVESMPWYRAALDADLEAALAARGIASGTVLDLGTGPGTQALELMKRGFTVTGVDVAASAIERARALSSNVRWEQDDVLRSKLTERFDYVFDRGCFHVISPDDRPTYVASLKRLVKPGGRVFLKCFSVEQLGEWGPHRFSHQDIASCFGRDFDVESISDTTYQGTLDPPPKALFVVLAPKAR